MEVAESVSGQADRRTHVVLFDVHMEGVQHDLDSVHVYFFHKGLTFGTGVQKVALKAVQHLKTVIHAAFAGNLSDGPYVFDAACTVAFLVDGLCVVHRPVGIDSSADRVNIQDLELFENVGEEADGMFLYGGIRAAQVFIWSRTIPGCQNDAVVFCDLTHLDQLFI